MILQKPKTIASKPAGRAKSYQASFLPENKMSEELEFAFHQNNEFKQLMQIPDKVISKYIEKQTNNLKI